MAQLKLLNQYDAPAAPKGGSGGPGAKGGGGLGGILFGRRLTQSRIDYLKDERPPTPDDLITIRPRGLPADLPFREEGLILERNQSLHRPVCMEDEDARLIPFLPVRTASDQDNLRIFPQTTEKEANRHFIVLMDPTGEEKQRNLELTEEYVRKAQERKDCAPEAIPIYDPEEAEEEVEDEDEFEPVDELEKQLEELEKQVEELEKEEEEEESSSEESSEEDESDYEGDGGGFGGGGFGGGGMGALLMMMMMMGGMGGGGGCCNTPNYYWNGATAMPYGYGYETPCFEDICCPSPPVPKPKPKKKKKKEGLDFEFLPHENFATQIQLTIEPEDPDPLECAMNSGVMPIVCCYMPPCVGMDGDKKEGEGTSASSSSYYSKSYGSYGPYSSYGPYGSYTKSGSQSGSGSYSGSKSGSGSASGSYSGSPSGSSSGSGSGSPSGSGSKSKSKSGASG